MKERKKGNETFFFMFISFLSYSDDLFRLCESVKFAGDRPTVTETEAEKSRRKSI